MYLTRYVDPALRSCRVGLEDHEGSLRELAPVDLPELLALPLAAIREMVASPGRVVEAVGPILPPIAGRTEVWASGVTYARSRAARVEESTVADVYARVYTSVRPELFFKASAWRVRTDGEPVGVRSDSPLNVPEPELAVLTNSAGELVGYTICNDVSSRTIEGENPLYLPQAKIYTGSCAVHHRVKLAWHMERPQDTRIACLVSRAGEAVWQAETSTGRMRRQVPELVDWLYRGQRFPAGALLSTGTGLVPDIDVTLRPGDVVRIEIDGIGVLTNPVESVGCTGVDRW